MTNRQPCSTMELLAEIRSIKKQLLVLRVAVCVVVMLAVTVCLAGWKSPDGLVECKALSVVGDDGKPRFTVEVDDAGNPWLSVRSGTGDALMELKCDESRSVEWRLQRSATSAAWTVLIRDDNYIRSDLRNSERDSGIGDCVDGDTVSTGLFADTVTRCLQLVDANKNFFLQAYSPKGKEVIRLAQDSGGGALELRTLQGQGWLSAEVVEGGVRPLLKVGIQGKGHMVLDPGIVGGEAKLHRADGAVLDLIDHE